MGLTQHRSPRNESVRAEPVEAQLGTSTGPVRTDQHKQNGNLTTRPVEVARPAGRWQGLRNPRTTRTLWLLLALLALVAAVDCARLLQHQRWNGLIMSGAVPADVGPESNPVPELRFAIAHAHAASGAQSGLPAGGANRDEEAALNRYRTLQGDSALGQAARFNSANLLLRQALRLQAAEQRGAAVPLVELAKETYREVLRNDPQHWPARYNLERAQRLLPDPEDGDNGLAELPQQAERSATTMRGYSPGLP